MASIASRWGTRYATVHVDAGLLAEDSRLTRAWTSAFLLSSRDLAVTETSDCIPRAYTHMATCEISERERTATIKS